MPTSRRKPEPERDAPPRRPSTFFVTTYEVVTLPGGERVRVTTFQLVTVSAEGDALPSA